MGLYKHLEYVKDGFDLTELRIGAEYLYVSVKQYTCTKILDKLIVASSLRGIV